MASITSTEGHDWPELDQVPVSACGRPADADVRALVVSEARASCRLGGSDEFCRSFDRLNVDLFKAVTPWRTFRWYEGQKHYSGSYWSATTRGHIIYESRLELARLIFADFDRSVQHICAQPFLLQAIVQGEKCRHVPDFVLITDGGPVVVDVKPRARLARPKVEFTLNWSRRVVEARGWCYEVWTEPDDVELMNLRFLSGYRRAFLFRPEVLERLEAEEIDGLTIAQAVAAVDDVPADVVRGCLFHLLWRQTYTVDITSPLSSRHTLRRRSL